GGGVLNVLSGGLISGQSFSGTGISGGTVNVSAGGSAAFLGVGTSGTGGVLNVLAGGIAANYTVSGTGSANVLGTVTSNATVFGVQDVSAGGGAAARPRVRP